MADLIGLPANEALARRLDIVARDYLLTRYSGPGNPMGTQILCVGNAVATKVPFVRSNPLMNTARGIEHPDELAEVLSFYADDREASASAGASPHLCWIETSPYTPASVTDVLIARGFRLERQAATLYAAPLPAPRTRSGKTAALAIRDAASATLEPFLDTLNRGFGVPEGALPGLRANQSFWCDVPTWHLFTAMQGDELVGAAVLSVQDDAELGRIGYLAAASTLEQMRGRGAQSALIAARIERARSLGCGLITGQAAWGTTSQANMQRAGLQISHLRTVWHGHVVA